MGYGIKFRVWGEYACFTRPEFKVERVSYDVITPSAARGILECVYWKPAIRWVIDKIIVINPIRFGNINLNEIKSKVQKPNKDFSNGEAITMYATIKDDNRVQRGMMYLKDVEYIIEAHFELTGIGDDSKTEDDCKKHYNIVLRRLKEGQTFKQPCLGLRNFSANFEIVNNNQTFSSQLVGERDLGFMLYDLDFKKDKQGKVLNDADPIFYRPVMKNGFIDVSYYYSVTKVGGGTNVDK